MRTDLADFEKAASHQLGLGSIVAGFVFALFIQGAAVVINYTKTDSATWVIHTITVDSEINKYFSLLQDLETGQRGYLLTQDETYLVPYRIALGQIESQIETISALVSDNLEQVDRVKRLADLAQKKAQELDETIQLVRTENLVDALDVVQTDRGKLIMDDVRRVVAAMQEEEARLLQLRVEGYETAIWVSRGLSAFSLFIALGLLIVIYRRGHFLIHEFIKDFVAYREQAESELLEAKRKAEEANREKGGFMARMSHELRTPLNAIQGFGETMKLGVHGPLGSKKYEEYVEDILASSHLLLSHVEDILNMTTLEAGGRSFPRHEIHLNEVVEEVIRRFSPQLGERELAIDFSQIESPVLIEANRRSVIQILSNVLSNAIKFSDNRGVITVSLSRDEASATVSVADNGDGMVEEVVSRITEPYFQGRSNPHLAREGTGLGMAIVSSLVKANEARMVIDSQVGSGTTVTIIFPLTLSGGREAGRQDENGPEAVAQ